MADYHLETGSTPVRPTREIKLKSIPEKIKLIKDIVEYLENKDLINEPDKLIQFLKKIELANGKDWFCEGDENSFSIIEDKLVYNYWYTSYHNGSIYGRQTREFEFTDEICEFVLHYLRKQYEAFEFARLSKLEELERIRRIKGQIISPENRFL